MSAITPNCVHEVIPEGDDELREICGAMKSHIERSASPREFAAWLGLETGVAGYVYDTVPVALYCGRSAADFTDAVEAQSLPRISNIHVLVTRTTYGNLIRINPTGIDKLGLHPVAEKRHNVFMMKSSISVKDSPLSRCDSFCIEGNAS